MKQANNNQQPTVYIDRETIQAIATEINNQQRERVHKNNITCDRTPQQNNKNSGRKQNQQNLNNNAKYFIICIWVIVMIALFIKLAPYL